jgi:hypothetical protein
MDTILSRYRQVALRASVLLVGVVCEASALRVWDIYAALVTASGASLRGGFHDPSVWEHLGPMTNSSRSLAMVLALSGSLLGWVDSAHRPRIPGILVGIGGLAVAVMACALV